MPEPDYADFKPIVPAWEYLNLPEDGNDAVLVLGVHEGWSRAENPPLHYRARPGRTFLPIVHQTAGHACHQRKIFGTILPIRPEAQEFVAALVKRYQDSCVGQWGVRLSELSEYRGLLQGFGLDCDWSYPLLEEGILPIDCSPEALAKLTAETLPENLDDLLQWTSQAGQWLGSMNRWGLYVLFENCD